MRTIIIFFLFVIYSISITAGESSCNPKECQERKILLFNEFSIPYKVVHKYGREWLVWPNEYNEKANIIGRHTDTSLSTTKVDLLFELGYQKEGVNLLKQLAVEGDINAQNYLALEYVIGRHLDRNYQQAKSWYEKAINDGNTFSYVGLAVLYENGWGVKKNEHKALSLYKIAAKHNGKEAICKIGNFYRDGKAGLKPDEIEAKKYYKKVRDSSKYGFDCSKIQ